MTSISSAEPIRVELAEVTARPEAGVVHDQLDRLLFVSDALDDGRLPGVGRQVGDEHFDRGMTFRE